MWYNDVLDFHKKFSCLIQDRPGIPDKITKDLRWSLVDEEINKELRQAFEDDNLEEIADAIVDSIYILIGMGISHGIDLREIWDEVQKCNMAKEGGGKRQDGKILKPEGWKPPRIKELIQQQRNK